MKKGFLFILGVVTGVAGSYIYTKKEKLRNYGQSLLNKYKGDIVEEIPSDPNEEQGAAE